MEALLKELKRKIVEELMLEDVDPAAIPDDAPFFERGLGLDSVDLLVLVAMLDREYGVEIFTRELGEKVLINIQTLAEHVSTHRKQ
jgi:acyl carrier protein